MLGVFAKVPAEGSVKTRLGGPPGFGVKVAQAFLGDTLQRLGSLTVRKVLVYSPDEIAAKGWEAKAQGDGDLGTRLRRFVEYGLSEGDRVVVVGTDAPTMPVEFVGLAMELLDEADVVLGPATDGGYYLVGAARRVPPIFDGIDWSSERVLAQTVARMGEARLALLPPWYDVDTAEGWAMLCGHVGAMRRAGVDPGVPRTEEVMRGA